MTTNWGNAQFNKAPFTNGAGVQQNGLVKLWHYRRTAPSPSLEPAILDPGISPSESNFRNYPWVSSNSSEYHVRTSDGAVGIVIVPRPKSFLKVRLNWHGSFIADWDGGGGGATVTNPGIRIRIAPRLGISAIKLPAIEAQRAENYWVGNRDPAVGTISQYVVPFSFDATWIIPLQDVASKYPDVFTMPENIKNDFTLDMNWILSVAGAGTAQPNRGIWIRDLESTVEQFQNVSYHNEEVVL